MMIMFVYLISLAPQDPNSTIDNFGHFGGLITGILAGLCIPAPVESNRYERNCRILGIIILSMFFLLCILLFRYVKFASLIEEDDLD